QQYPRNQSSTRRRNEGSSLRQTFAAPQRQTQLRRRHSPMNTPVDIAVEGRARCPQRAATNPSALAGQRPAEDSRPYFALSAFIILVLFGCATPPKSTSSSATANG